MTVIFVGGAARAGTTLLHSVVCSARGTNPPVSEDRSLVHIVRSYAEARQTFESHTRFVYGDRETLRSFHVDTLRRYLDLIQAAWPDAEHLVIKHPMLTAHFPVLADLLPDARFAISLRDPRAIVASLVRAAERQVAEEGRGGSVDSIAPFVQRIRHHYVAALRHFSRHDQERCALVRYEDLVREPRPTAVRLGTQLGLDLSAYDPDAPWRGWTDGTVDVDERRRSAYFSELWGQPVSPERLEAWREDLGPARRARVERSLGRLMAHMGYPTAAQGESPP